MNDVRWKVDGYQEWLDRQKLPVHSGLAIELMQVETAPWPLIGADAAFVHLDARGDYCTLHLVDIPAGGSTKRLGHLYEEVVYVLDGQGSTSFELPDGSRQTFEWGRGSLFSLPLNVRYQHFNASGTARARLACVSNLPMVMKLFRNEEFIFDTPFAFTERLTDPKFLRGEGTFIPTREHRHMWETNLVPNLLTFDQLRESPGRGAGSTNIMFLLAEGTLHAHASEIPVGGYKKAHVHGEGYHIFQLSGEGYSLYWYKGQEPVRVDWDYGTLHSPPLGMWHQHFNTSDTPARYLAIGFGSMRYPFLNEKMKMVDRTYTTKSEFQIDYEDEDPAIRQQFDAERAAWLEKKTAAAGR
jgi:uncharacterized RmlC-like cupin family protein